MEVYEDENRNIKKVADRVASYQRTKSITGAGQPVDRDETVSGGTQMASHRILALVLLAVGLVLIFFGYQFSQDPGGDMAHTVTGRFNDATAWLLFLGAMAALAGSAVTGIELVLFGKSTNK
ncbi:DUF3185 family protein [Marinobacter sp. LN3S78]|uniref:DUF3185 family protein n=1 Tax=Marinobacter sp. LN3S78 TaxID=3382300 RepID=UPI00387AB133